jgi:recombinational DNA repair protein RecR
MKETFMNAEGTQTRRPTLRFNESEIKLALSVMDKMEKPIELMYYLMDREREKPFVILLISAENIELESLLSQEKRDTDLLFTIDESKNIYALICQETKVDGAYRFAERLLRTLVLNNAHSIYCTEMEIRSTKYAIKEVIFKSIESYITANKEKKEGEIIFRSLQ